MDELLTMSVTEMARRIREGEISPSEAVDAHIKRIEQVNPLINAVVVSCFDEARRRAKQAEELLAKGRDGLPPLLGVPCTVKDSFALKGYPHAVGVWARKGKVADADATVVERIKAAGAIPIGKTNTPEAAMHMESYNYVYGRTNNPYDLTRGAGGSSGGEGAIIAAGGSPFGPGSDLGGSIRYPSAFNGIAGHQPSGRLVPATGHWPPGHGPLAPYLCCGPMARRVTDLPLLLKIFAGPDGKDQVVKDQEVKSPQEVDMKKMRVYFFESNGQARGDDDVSRAVDMAVGALAAEKIAVEHWVPEGMEQSLMIWIAGMAQNPDPFYLTQGDGEAIPLGREFLRFITRTSKLTFPALGAALVEFPGKLLKGLNQRTLNLADELRARIEEKLDDNGVIIYPVFSTPAPKHNRNLVTFTGIGFSGVTNILEFPSTVVPIYHRRDGLPVAGQIIAKRFNDHLTLATAIKLEEIFGGWKPIEKVGG